MPAPVDTVKTDDTLPAEADVVLIGGGVVGVFSAYYLARRGLKVVLLEKGRIGAEQSSRNWGWCRQQNRDARELPMASKSLALWEDFKTASGEDAGFYRSGLLYLSNDEAEIAGWARWNEFAKGAGVETYMLSIAEATQRGSVTGKSWRGGVYAPEDGIADPARAAPAVARAIVKLGGTVVQGCAARGIETTAGRLSGVVTEKGVIRTKTAVLAGGAWASSFCRQLGIRFPLASIRSTILSIGPGAETIPDALHTAAVSLTRRGDGGHTLAISGFGRVDPTPQKLAFAKEFLPMFKRRWRSLSIGNLEGVRAGHETLSRWALDRPTPMERMRILDPAPDTGTVAMTHARALELIPALNGRPVTAAWAGFIDSTPDGVPAIGEIQSIPGFILAAGFSGHGFGISPGAGHLIADLITGDEPIVNPRPYHLDRFSASAWGKVAQF